MINPPASPVQVVRPRSRSGSDHVVSAAASRSTSDSLTPVAKKRARDRPFSGRDRTYDGW